MMKVGSKQSTNKRSVFDIIKASLFTELAIDFGTTNTRIYVKHTGIILNEPTVIARHQKTERTMAVGKQAESMLGKAPKTIVATRPLERGVISDFESAQALLTFFIKQISRQPKRFPINLLTTIVVAIPAGVTEVERKAFIDAGLSAGARKVLLLEKPMAAAIGADLPFDDAKASMVLDIGGGVSEVAVLSWTGIVNNQLLPVAGDEIDHQLVEWLRNTHNILVGKQTAERLKFSIHISDNERSELLKARGRDLSTGLPREVLLQHSDVAKAISKPLHQLAEMVHDLIEETPPELVADLVSTGLVVVGGGARLMGIDQFLADRLQIPVKLAENPDLAVIKGLAKVLENPRLLDKVQVAWGN